MNHFMSGMDYILPYNGRMIRLRVLNEKDALALINQRQNNGNAVGHNSTDESGNTDS
jgi:hypothetical protein